MTVKRSGLGRNLSALLGPSSDAVLIEKSSTTPTKLAVHCLQPGKYQPRTDISDASLQDLTQSIKKQGLLQPLLVRALPNGHYEIIAGERRWRASQLAGLTEVPVVVKQVDDETAMAMALVENLQREDLNAMDQARAMQRLTLEFALTHQQIADLLSKSRAAISNYLRLLALAESVKKLVEQGNLDMGHARALLVLESSQQIHAAQIVIAKNLSVRETEKLVQRMHQGITTEADTHQPSPTHYAMQLRHLAQQLNAKVSLKPNKSGKGSLVIQYDNSNALERIITLLINE